MPTNIYKNTEFQEIITMSEQKTYTQAGYEALKKELTDINVKILPLLGSVS